MPRHVLSGPGLGVRMITGEGIVRPTQRDCPSVLALFYCLTATGRTPGNRMKYQLLSRLLCYGQNRNPVIYPQPENSGHARRIPIRAFGKARISKPKTKGVRGVRLFLWGRQAGQSRAVALPFQYNFSLHRYRPDTP